MYLTDRADALKDKLVFKAVQALCVTPEIDLATHAAETKACKRQIVALTNPSNYDNVRQSEQVRLLGTLIATTVSSLVYLCMFPDSANAPPNTLLMTTTPSLLLADGILVLACPKRTKSHLALRMPPT
jgi:hypothetical protein